MVRVFYESPPPFSPSFCSAQLHVENVETFERTKVGYLTCCVIKTYMRIKQPARSIRAWNKVLFLIFFTHAASASFALFFSLLPSPMAESGRAMGSKTCEQQNVGQPSVLSYRLETAVFAGHSLCLLELAAMHCRAVQSKNFTVGTIPALKCSHSREEGKNKNSLLVCLESRSPASNCEQVWRIFFADTHFVVCLLWRACFL